MGKYRGKGVACPMLIFGGTRCGGELPTPPKPLSEYTDQEVFEIFGKSVLAQRQRARKIAEARQARIMERIRQVEAHRKLCEARSRERGES